MKLAAVVFLSVTTLIAAPKKLAAEEGRFDAQVFRPLAAPRDLVMVPKSEVIGHLAPVVGVYWDVALNPLALVIGDTGKTLDIVGARLQITPLLGIGLFNQVEITAAVPFVAWQTSENLRSVGTEGSMKSSPTLGDIRLQSKVALPFFNRREEVKSGFGLALAGNLNLPTGDPLAFSSDGGLSGGAQIIGDYRFGFGLILASNLGVWIRPEHQFASVKIGDMAQFGIAAEMYVVQRWGLSVIAEIYGYPALTKFPDQADQVPAEALLGVRWQTRQGITVTVGGSFGAACGFGAPALRVFNAVTWQPKSSVEQREINRVLEQDSADPDRDGLLEPADQCPSVPGLPENNGCPDQDRDHDGVIDRDDQCPDLAAGPSGSQGCPLAHVDRGTIALFEPITFETDSDELSERAKLILKSVVRVMHDKPMIRELRVDVHADAREGGGRGVLIAYERAKAIVQWMVDEGVEPSRLSPQPFVLFQPIVDDSNCLGPEEESSQVCRAARRLNHRVSFKITRWGAPGAREILGRRPASVLPLKLKDEEAKSPLLPTCRPWRKGGVEPTPCVLPIKPAVLGQGRVLQDAKDGKGSLPSGPANRLPNDGVLQKEHGALPSISK